MTPGSNSAAPTFIMYAAIILIFYFVLLRPQQQQRKKHEASIKAVKKGDEIVTAGGIIGEVIHIKTGPDGVASDADRITIRSDQSRFVIERGRIARVVTPAVTTGEAKTPASGGTA
jgi:preprotein translocase subunit YajC